MLRQSLPLIIGALLLTGCTVRSADQPSPAPTKSGPQMETLDKSDARLAEVTVPMAKLGATLRKIGQFDAHLEWNDEFIKQTITEASLLKENDRLEGQMMAEVMGNSAEIQVVIIRVAEDQYAVRAITSKQLIAEAINDAIKK